MTALSNRYFEDRALTHFECGYHCSESTFLGLVEYLGIDSDLFPRIASGFHGGYGLSGLVCGSLSSSVMALGIKFGRSDPSASPWSVTDKVNLMVNDFKNHAGSVFCPEIIQCDAWDPVQLNDYLVNRRMPVCGEKIIRFAVSRCIEIMEAVWPPPDQGRAATMLGITSLGEPGSIYTDASTEIGDI